MDMVERANLLVEFLAVLNKRSPQTDSVRETIQNVSDELERLLIPSTNKKKEDKPTGGYVTSVLSGVNLNSRCEADIENIAKELSKLVKREASRKGVTF